MKTFTYGDENITEKELLVAVPSMVIGVGVLTLPKQIAMYTTASDGWISLAVTGIMSMLIIWIVGNLASTFPHQSFLSYTSILVTRPVAVVLTLIYSIVGIFLSALIVRTLTDIAKQYLFNHTPLEVIALSFLLVVVYAVAGSRAGLFRLNMMFFPIIFFIAFVVMVFNMRWFDFQNFLPVFKTDLKGYLAAGRESLMTYMGAGVFLFYMVLVENPKKTPRMLVAGMIFPVVFYIAIFLLCISVFGNAATSNLIYPVIELAKRVEVTGGILERFESIFFVVWIMAVFNSTVLSLDASVMAIQSVFKKVSKLQLLYVLAPVVYFISMFPENFRQVTELKSVFGVTVTLFTYVTVLVLFTIAKMKGVRQGG